MYNQRIRFLEETLRQVDSRLQEESTQELIEQRTRVLSELSRMRREQWEEDHERVDLDDQDY